VIDVLNILTCRSKGQGHQKTVLTIDWSGISEEQLRVLARSAIIHSLQHLYRQPLHSVPEEHVVKAVDFVKGELHEVLIDRPKPVRQQLKGAMETKLEQMLAALSPQEREQLLGEL